MGNTRDMYIRVRPKTYSYCKLEPAELFSSAPLIVPQVDNSSRVVFSGILIPDWGFSRFLIGCLSADDALGIAALINKASAGVVTGLRGEASSMTRHESTQVPGLPLRIESLTTHSNHQVMSNDRRHIRPNDKNIGGTISSETPGHYHISLRNAAVILPLAINSSCI